MMSDKDLLEEIEKLKQALHLGGHLRPDGILCDYLATGTVCNKCGATDRAYAVTKERDSLREEIERLRAIKEIAKEQACKWGTLTEALSVEFAKEPESVPGANVGDCAIAMIRRLTTQRDRLLEGMRETVSDLRMFRQMVQEGAPKSQLLEYLNRREDAIATYHLGTDDAKG